MENFIIISKKKLLEALLRGSKIINSKSLSTVALGFLFEINNDKLIIHSTDLGNFLIQTIDIKNNNNEKTEFIIDLVILELLKKIPDENINIFLKLDQSKIILVDEKNAQYSIPVKKSKFPKKTILETELITQIKIKDFQNLLKAIMIGLSENDNFAIIFEENKTIFKVFDIFRCSYIEHIQNNKKIITKYLNIKLLENLFKIFENKQETDKLINIYSLSEDIVFETDNIYLICIKGSGGYFNSNISLSNICNFKVNLKELKHIIDTQLVMSEKRVLLMKFFFKKHLLEISSRDVSTERYGYASLKGYGPVEPQSGFELDINFSFAFNAGYLAESLSCGSNEDHVLIQFSTGNGFNKFIVNLNGVHLIPFSSGGIPDKNQIFSYHNI